jgi:hypothetical protein
VGLLVSDKNDPSRGMFPQDVADCSTKERGEVGLRVLNAIYQPEIWSLIVNFDGSIRYGINMRILADGGRNQKGRSKPQHPFE